MCLWWKRRFLMLLKRGTRLANRLVVLCFYKASRVLLKVLRVQIGQPFEIYLPPKVAFGR